MQLVEDSGAENSVEGLSIDAEEFGKILKSSGNPEKLRAYAVSFAKGCAWLHLFEGGGR